MKDERFKELLIDDEQLFRHIRDSVNIPASLSVPDTAAQGRCPGCGSHFKTTRKWTDNGGMPEKCDNDWHESLPDTGTQAAEGLLVEALSEILERFPSPDVIEEIRADAGYGFRKYQINATDKDIVKWRQALFTYKQGKTPKE